MILGRVARWVCNRAGYELVPISRFARLLSDYVKRNPRMTFVQIGANDGILFDNLYYFVTEHRCNGLVVEPLSDYFERLALNYRAYPGIKPVRAAVHPSLRQCTLYRVDPSHLATLPNWTAGIASLDPAHYKRTGIADHYIIEETVDSMPLMELFERHEIHKLDLLQIDTEGFDAEVIAMIDFARIKPAIIKYEHVNLDGAVRADTQLLLQRHGYACMQDGNDTIATLNGWRQVSRARLPLAQRARHPRPAELDRP